MLERLSIEIKLGDVLEMTMSFMTVETQESGFGMDSVDEQQAKYIGDGVKILFVRVQAPKERIVEMGLSECNGRVTSCICTSSDQIIPRAFSGIINKIQPPNKPLEWDKGGL